MPNNPLLGLVGYSGPADDQELLNMATEWPPRWWKQLLGVDSQVQATHPAPQVLPAANAHPSVGAQQRYFDQHGILPGMARSNIPEVIRRRVYEGINPEGYTGHDSEISALRAGGKLSRSIPTGTAREDAWRLYMGFPQQGHTFVVSQNRPSRSTNPSAVYFSINPDANSNGIASAAGLFADNNRPGVDINWVLRHIEEEARLTHTDPTKNSVQGPMYDGIMGNFRVSLGQDQRGHYVAYYDNWNLEGNPVEGEHGRLGKPFEIYDRIYYDPRTGRSIDPSKPR